MPLFSRVKDIFKGGSLNKKKKVYNNVKLENPEEFWEIVCELGDGAYGKVYKAEHKVTGKLAALKLVPLEGEDDLDTFMVEIDILSEFKHPNIVELLEAYHFDGKLWMYLEYCDGGAVDSIMVDLDRPLTEAQIAIICQSLCHALCYVHSNKVIHRDLKAGNVLLTTEGGVKLADFGVSAKNKNTMDKRGTFIGTPYWLAPEVILCETFIDAKYDYKADVWSLGVCLIEFAQMEPPNHDVSPVRVMLKIQKSDPPKLDKPHKWSKNFNDFIAKCLVKDPLLRPSAEDLLEHPFMKNRIDMKPILDLLLEYNAEVVEEVEEEADDHHHFPIRANSTTESFNQDTESIASTDRNNFDDKSSVIENEISPTGDKRVSKGPAPMPPGPTPKKGPAPTPPATPTDNNIAPIAVVTKVNGVSSDEKVSSTAVSPAQPQPKPSIVEELPVVEEKISTPPKESKSEEVSHVSVSVCQESNKDVIVSVEPKDNIVIEPVDHKVSISLDSTSDYTVPHKDHIEDGLQSGTVTVEVNQSPPKSPVPMETNIEVIPEIKTNDESKEHIDVTSGNANYVNTSPEVVLASISSEGTVIVRTPTPTQTPRDAESPNEKQENVVTYSVPENTPEESLEPVRPSTEEVSLTSPEVILSPDESDHANMESLSEAEAQAVLFLETAIDSACVDMTYSNSDSVAGSNDISIDDETDNTVMVDSGHKLDSSEVLISGSSIPEGEEDKKNSSGHEALPPSSVSSTSAELNETHVSVISVAQETSDSMSTGQESTKEEVSLTDDHPEPVCTPCVIDQVQVSLTIDGTTVEDTDVDQIQDSPHDSQIVNGAMKEREQVSDSPVPVSEPEEVTTSFVEPSNDVPEDVSVVSKSPEPSPQIQRPNDLPPQQKEEAHKDVLQNGIVSDGSLSKPKERVKSTSESNKENDLPSQTGTEEVVLRRPGGARKGPVLALSARANQNDGTTLASRSHKDKDSPESIALRKKTRKRTRKFVIDGVVVTTTTSKVIYGDDEEQGVLSSAHLARKQELRELKVIQRREQKQFQDLSTKANVAKLDQEKKFDVEMMNLLRNYDSQLENLIRQQKQMVEKAEVKQEAELKTESRKIRNDQERELKAFKESMKQEWKLLKQEVEMIPKDRRKEGMKMRKEQLEKEQADRERSFLERLNDQHELCLKRLNDKHREHIALKERQFLEEKHQLLRSRESAIWDVEERHIQDKHQLAKEQLKDIYFLQRLQMTIRHNVELEQVRRYNQQKEDALLKRQHEEKRQLPKRIRQEMKTREKMFKEQIRISMSTLPSHEQEKGQIKKFQEQEKIKYDKERKRAESKHKKQLEELTASMEASIKELVHLQNEKGKLLTEHETYKLKSLDEEYQKELREWKSNLAPRKQKLEEEFDVQLRDQEKFYGDYLDRGLKISTPSSSCSNLN